MWQAVCDMFPPVCGRLVYKALDYILPYVWQAIYNPTRGRLFEDLGGDNRYCLMTKHLELAAKGQHEGLTKVS